MYMEKKMTNETAEALVRVIQAGVNPKENMLVLYNSCKPLFLDNIRKLGYCEETWDDLLQECYVILHQVVMDYKFGKGVDFPSHLWIRIKWGLIDYLEKAGEIKQNRDIKRYLKQMRDFRESFNLEYRRYPTWDEIQEHMGISRKKLCEILQFESLSTDVKSLDVSVKNSNNSESKDNLLVNLLYSLNNTCAVAVSNVMCEELKKNIVKLVGITGYEMVTLHHLYGWAEKELGVKYKIKYKTVNRRLCNYRKKIKDADEIKEIAIEYGISCAWD